MKDQLISFETAKLAKEKGFNGKCRTKIHCSHYHLIKNNIIPDNIPTSEDDLFAPCKDWNNEESGDPNHKGQKLIGLSLSLPTQSLLQKWLREKHNIHIWVTYNYPINGTYIVVLMFKNLNTSHNTYEEALEAGLFEALNLIK